MPKKVRRGTKIEISENVVFSEQYSGQPNGGEGGALDQQTVRMPPACHPTFCTRRSSVTWEGIVFALVQYIPNLCHPPSIRFAASAFSS
jgi:hypothetical protein